MHCRSIADRFEEKVEPEPNTGCFLWVGGQNGRGYGAIGKGGRDGWMLAHRVAWEIARGSIPVGMHVLHRCDVTWCVNPAHLFLGTAADNARDCSQKKRQHKQKQTHCARGHAYVGANLQSVRGKRRCRACKLATTNAWRRRKGAA